MLTTTQKIAFDLLVDLSLAAKTAPSEKSADAIRLAAGYAYALRRDLVLSGHKIVFDKILLENRRVPVDAPDFFEQIHCLEDFIGIVGRIKSEE